MAYPEQEWHTFITVDITNKAKSGGTTFNVDDFIHYKLNEEDLYYFNTEFQENEQNPISAEPGDYVIFIGMHVSTREITDWIWQTFWWDANPDDPPLPSSKAITDARPDALWGAARNYAMA